MTATEFQMRHETDSFERDLSERLERLVATLHRWDQTLQALGDVGFAPRGGAANRSTRLARTRVRRESRGVTSA